MTESFFCDLETPRLLLKNISSSDRDFILKQFSDDAINKYLFDAEPMKDISEADELISFYTQTEPRIQHRWILTEKSSGKKIGTCGFHCWNKQEQTVELGYDLQSDFWGKGFMSEAMEIILQFAKDKMKVKKIYAHIFVDNKKSINLVQKFDFKFTGENKIYNFRGSDYLHHVYILDLKVPN